MPLKNSDGNPNALFAKKPNLGSTPQTYYDLQNTFEDIDNTLNEVITARDVENDGKVLTVIKETDSETGEEVAKIVAGEGQKPIEIDENEIPKGDGEDWVKKSEIYITEDENREYRVGPALVDSTTTTCPGGRFTITGNPNRVITGPYDNKDEKTYLASIGDNALVAIDGTSRLTIHDNSKVDITGGVDSPNIGPEVFVHGNTKVHIQGPIKDTTKLSNFRTMIESSTYPLIRMQDAPAVQMEGSAVIDMREKSIICMDDTALIRMHSSSSEIAPGPGILMDNGSILQMQGPSSGPGPSPWLHLNPDQFIVDTIGSHGVDDGIRTSGPYVRPVEPDYFFSENFRTNPQICIEKASVINISNAGRGFIKFESASGSKNFLQLDAASGKEQYHREANCNIETFDFIFRVSGAANPNRPWYDSSYHYGQSNNCRSVSSNPNGPLVQIYDKPVVTIRGTWDTSGQTIPEGWTEHPAKVAGSPRLEFIGDTDLLIDNGGIEVRGIENSTTFTTMLISPDSCLSLADSTEILMENTSSIQMEGIATALKMSGGAVIEATATSVKFSPSEGSTDSVEFTYDQLAALKNLITNS